MKKRDGSWRLCIDYRQLNNITKKDAYLLPRIDDSIDALSGSAYISMLDLVSGYWQVKMSNDAVEKAAFCTRGGPLHPSRLSFRFTSFASHLRTLDGEGVIRSAMEKFIIILR